MVEHMEQNFKVLQSSPPTTIVTPSTNRVTPSAILATPSATAETPSVTPATPSATRATPSVTRATPSATPATPSATRATPSVTRATPSVTRATPSATPATSSATRATPSVIRATPSATPATASATRATPSVTRATPSVTRATPSATPAAPSASRATPSVTPATPSATQATHSATLTTPSATQVTASATLTTPSATLATPLATPATPSLSTATPSADQAKPSATQTTSVTTGSVCLLVGWKKTLPEIDHNWVSKALFKKRQNGQAEFITSRVDKLWWYPPTPSLTPASLPSTERYFGHRLFLWMPRQMWRVCLVCPHPECEKRELTSSGIHQKVRHVVDVDSSYNIASEYLHCQKCHRKVIAWSHGILSQLDIGHRCQFPCLLTSKFACDIKVIRLLRSRGLGNSSSQIQKKLCEQHSETWLQKVLQYLTHCRGFKRAAEAGILQDLVIPDPPEMKAVPKYRWLMHVYCLDVLHRLTEIKASITSVFVNILKLDSTKKVVKKLAGRATKTAVWCTNVGNEYGQILTSVLTTAEGHGIAPMLDGIMQRYQAADVPPPRIIYVDRDCCGTSPLHQMLSGWDKTILRMDIWHFMRRISSGLTTDSHQLYGQFMDSLSNCIFEWDKVDLDRLVEAKAAELESKSGRALKEADVRRRISRKELSLHCQRKTRGVEETRTSIARLIDSYSGPAACDTLGVPLISKSRMDFAWSHQQKHLACIQDVPGISLYTQTGTVEKGGKVLPVYRCARGSTSLESFHLHLNRFIPGTLASDTHFQAYLLDGVFRWNHDRAESAVAGDPSESSHQSYSGAMQQAANMLGEAVLGKKICPTYTVPRKYTGELFGVEYLYMQTGKVLEDYKMAISKLETAEETQTDGDDGFEDEGFTEEMDSDFLTIPSLENTRPDLQGQSALPNSSLQETPVRKQLLIPLEPQFEDEPDLLLPEIPRHQLSFVQKPHPKTTSVEKPHTQPSHVEKPQLWLSPVEKSHPQLSPVDKPHPQSTPVEKPHPQSTPVEKLHPHSTPVEKLHPHSTPVEKAHPHSTPVEKAHPHLTPVEKAHPHLTPVEKYQHPQSSPLEKHDPQFQHQPSVNISPQLDSSSAETSAESVGPDNLPGFDKVQDLAEYLVELRRGSLALTNVQAANIVALWNCLDEKDRRPTVFAQRFAKTSKGRFRATKRVQNVSEGVESTQRCFLGPNKGPAQWPDCNRYTEAVIIQLLKVFPRDIRKSDEKMTRFGLVLSAYSHIRDCILNNATVMQQTKIQLPEINKGTLTQWFSKRAKVMDRRVLMQGISFQQPRQSSEGPTLKPLQKPEVLPTGKAEEHQFHLPDDTAGSAKLKRRKPEPAPTASVPFLHSSTVPSYQALPVNILPAGFQFQQHSTTPGNIFHAGIVPSTSAETSSVPYTTQRYRKRKMEEEKAGVKTVLPGLACQHTSSWFSISTTFHHTR